MERKILVLVLHSILKPRIYDLGREIGGENLKDAGIEDMKAAKFLFLDCLEEAFASVMKEIRGKLEKDKSKK